MDHHKLEDGASAAEYGLLIAGMGALIASVVFIFGDMISDVFTGTCEDLRDGSNPQIVLTCS